MTEPEAQFYRLSSGEAECVLQCDAAGSASMLHIGGALGEQLTESGFRRAQSGNLVDASALAPLLPDPALGWTSSPGWRDGPDPSKPWSSWGCQAEASQALRADYAHPDG